VIAHVSELIEQERAGGSSDPEICRLLQASSIRPPAPHRWRTWTPARLVEIAGPREARHGYTRRGALVRR